MLIQSTGQTIRGFQTTAGKWYFMDEGGDVGGPTNGAATEAEALQLFVAYATRYLAQQKANEERQQQIIKGELKIMFKVNGTDTVEQASVGKTSSELAQIRHLCAIGKCSLVKTGTKWQFRDDRGTVV